METQSKLSKFFEEEVQDIYWAEKHLIKSLPKMSKAATSTQLANAFEQHHKVTEGQIARLEEIFDALGKKPVGKKCEAMDGLVEEAKSIIEDTESNTLTRDCALIFAAQKIEHYEIAAYGSLKAVASILGYQEVRELLDKTLQEEKETDVTLTKIAESYVNVEAYNEQ